MNINKRTGMSKDKLHLEILRAFNVQMALGEGFHEVKLTKTFITVMNMKYCKYNCMKNVAELFMQFWPTETLHLYEYLHSYPNPRGT